MLRLLGSLALILVGQTSAWSYHGSNGPAYWHQTYPKCGHQKQSPINIQTSSVQTDSSLTAFTLTNYSTAPSSMTLKNNGHTAPVDLGSNSMELTGGGIEGTFKPAQFHFHWGSANSRGSEHQINGGDAPMEMHIVHYNTKYSSLSEAIDKDDGLTVFGFLFQISSSDSPAYAKVVNYLPNVQCKDQSVSIPTFDLLSLFPQNRNSYYRYEGSLTTPPCHESVKYWTVFTDRIPISDDQVDEFRKLHEEPQGTENNRRLVNNYRPVQPLNGRQVKASPSVKMGSMAAQPKSMLVAGGDL